MQSDRLKKASHKLRKIAPLAKSVKRSRVLIHTGALPQFAWGSAALGVAPTTIASIRKHAGAATGIVAPGRCLTTALALSIGPMRDPGVALPVMQVSTWIDLWKSDAQLRALTARHWSDICGRLFSADGDSIKPQWAKVLGPAAGTIAMLHDLDWDLRNPLRWIDPTGRAWVPDFTVDKQPFLDLVGQLARQSLWKKAAPHYLGSGLESGVCWQASAALHRHLTAKAAGRSPSHES